MRNLLIIIFSVLFVSCAMAEEQKKAGSVFKQAPLAVQEYEKSLNEKQRPETVTRPRLVFNIGRRDPFVSVIVKKEGGAQRSRAVDEGDSARAIIDSLSVQGLIWGGQFSQAIVNNKVYRAGDNIQGLLITNIDKNGITFSSSGKKYILSTQPAASSAKRG